MEQSPSKLEQIEKEIQAVQKKIRGIGVSSYGEWADGGDGWHDERWRENRLQYQIYEAHLKTLKTEQLRLKKATLQK